MLIELAQSLNVQITKVVKIMNDEYQAEPNWLPYYLLKKQK